MLKIYETFINCQVQRADHSGYRTFSIDPTHENLRLAWLAHYSPQYLFIAISDDDTP